MRFVVRRAYKLPVIEEKLPQDFDKENDPRHPTIIFRGMSVGESLALEQFKIENHTQEEMIRKEIELMKSLIIEAKGDFSLYLFSDEKLNTKDKEAVLCCLDLADYVGASQFAIFGREVTVEEKTSFLDT